MGKAETDKSRVPAIRPGLLSDRQLQVWQSIGGPRGGMVDGPFRAWLLADPELADRMNRVAEELRIRCGLDPRLIEIAVLCVAQFWRSDFQWSAHVPLALRLGVTQAVIDAIRGGTDLSFAKADEQLVHRCAETLLRTKALPDTLYDELVEEFSAARLVALVTIVGQYSLADIVTNGFRVGSVDGQKHFR